MADAGDSLAAFSTEDQKQLDDDKVSRVEAARALVLLLWMADVAPGRPQSPPPLLPPCSSQGRAHSSVKWESCTGKPWDVEEEKGFVSGEEMGLCERCRKQHRKQTLAETQTKRAVRTSFPHTTHGAAQRQSTRLDILPPHAHPGIIRSASRAARSDGDAPFFVHERRRRSD